MTAERYSTALPTMSSGGSLPPQYHGLIQLGPVRALAAAGPVDRHFRRPCRRADAKVERQIVLATAASAGFNLPGECPVAHLDDDTRADAQPIALARAFQAHFQVAVLANRGMFAQRIDPDLAAGNEVEKTIAVDVGERGLICLVRR